MRLPRFVHDTFLRFVFGASLVILLGAFSYGYVTFIDSDVTLVIHSDRYSENRFLGDRSDVFTILLTGFILLILNMILSAVLYDRDRFYAYVFAVGTFLLVVLLFFVISSIIAVN